MRRMEINIKGIFFGLIMCLSIILITQTTYAGDPPEGVLAVDIDATGNDDGTSWEDAFTDLQDALDDAVLPHDPPITQIWVAEGEYKPDPDGDDRAATFTLVNLVEIYGGFAGGESALNQRDPLLNDTRLVASYNLSSIYRRYHVIP